MVVPFHDGRSWQASLRYSERCEVSDGSSAKHGHKTGDRSRFNYVRETVGAGKAPLALSVNAGMLVPICHRTWIMPTTVEDKSRVTARVPAELRETIEQAASIRGATLNQFLVQSAYQEAQRILERETVIRLSQRDARKMFDLLEHPPKANRQLKAAVKAYRTLIRA